MLKTSLENALFFKFWIEVNVLRLRSTAPRELSPFPAISVYTVVFSSNCVWRQSADVHAGVVNAHPALIKPT